MTTDSNETKTYKVSDVYEAAAHMFAKEMQNLKGGKPLTEKEKETAMHLAKTVSRGVLENMGVI